MPSPARFAGILCLLPLAMVGCKGTYDVTVRNDSARSVTASLVSEPFMGDPVIHRTATLRAGDRIDFPEFTLGFEQVELEVSRPNEMGARPETIAVPRGRSAFVVSEAGPESWVGYAVQRIDVDTLEDDGAED